MQIWIALLISLTAAAKEIDTNNVYMSDAPLWVTRPRVEKITNRIQTALEWDIRKVTVTWHTDENKFQNAHSLGPNMLAVTLKNTNTIHLGPRVTNANFDQVFGHELVHIIAYQKYKQAIPQWLEEGVANHLAKSAQVDYKWLGSKPFPADVRSFNHPASGTKDEIHFHYATSQAVMEMIAKKCDITNLFRLSVGEKMDPYLETYCEIRDLNAAYRKWLKQKAGLK